MSFGVLYLLKSASEPNTKYPEIKKIEKQYNYYDKK